MRVVIFRTDKIGDLIISTPVIGAIKAAHPAAKIMLVASPYNAVTVQGLETIDEIVLFDKNNKKTAQRAIKHFRPTHALVLSPKNDCYFMAWHSGAKIRGGLLMEYRWLPRLLAAFLLTHSVFIPRKRERHQTEAILSLARGMNIAAAGDFPYRIARGENTHSVLHENNRARPFIAVHLTDKFLEAWSVDDVRLFLKQASAATGLAMVATAGPADKTLSAALEGEMPVLKNLSFHAWADVFAAAQAIIAPDSAAVHLACALEKPLLALYLSSRLHEALTEFGPRQTRFITHPLGAPARDIPVFISDLKALLT